VKKKNGSQNHIATAGKGSNMEKDNGKLNNLQDLNDFSGATTL